ncbi:MAG: sulfite exporter TauE/SafE family protein [Proteobacteria bacterium]|nr:sulfite exporter TauE/SafE family protein [Pseudomonadota bacterium]
MPEWTPLTIAGVALAMSAGGFCKGASGISLVLIALSVATIFVDIALAVALLSVPVMIANIWQIGSNKFTGDAWRNHWPIYVAIPPGVAIGAKVLTSVDPILVSGIVGIIVITFAILLYAQPNWHIPHSASRRYGVPVGFVGGLIAGISGTLPPVLLFIVALKLPKERFVAAIGIAYLVAVVAVMVFLATYNYLTWNIILWSSLAAVPMFVGQLLGHKMRRRIAENPFRLLVLTLMILSGANLIRKAIF